VLKDGVVSHCRNKFTDALCAPRWVVLKTCPESVNLDGGLVAPSSLHAETNSTASSNSVSQ